MIEDELRSAWRAVRRHPWKSLVRAATAAAGLTVGVNAFVLMDAIFLKPLPFPDPDSLFVVGRASEVVPGYLGALSTDDLDELARLPGVLGVAGIRPASFESRFAEGEGLRAVEVTSTFFDVLGVRPAIGHLLPAGRDVPADPRPAIIGDALWRSRFGADPAIVGRVVTLGGRAVSLVGVMPPGFEFPGGSNVWLARVDRSRPFVVRDSTALVRWMRTPSRLDVLVHLRSGRVAMRPLREYVRPGHVSDAVLMSGVALLVVWLVAVHVFALRLRMSIERGEEFTVRAALGATRAHLARQTGLEVAIEAGTALVLAAVFAPATLAVWRRWLPPELTVAQPITVDRRAWACLLGVALVTGVAAMAGAIVGLARRGAREPGRIGTRAQAREPTRHLVLAGHAGLVAAVVYLAALAGESYVAAMRADLGPDVRGLVAVEVPAPLAGAGRETLEMRTEEVVTRLAGLPGVVAVAAGPEPLSAGGLLVSVTAEPARTPLELARAERRVVERSVSAAYLRVAGIRILDGRDFDPRLDQPGTAVVLSQTLARSIGASGSLVARPVYVDSTAPRRVVGVAEDVRAQGPDQPPALLLYSLGRGSGTVLVRLEEGGAADRVRILAQIRQVVREVTGASGPIRIQFEEETAARLTAAQRARAATLGVLAAVSVWLGVLGLSAAAVEAVRERRRDIAVRLALGAPRARVTRETMSSVVLAAGLGTAGGLALGVTGTRAMTSLGVFMWPADGSTLAVAGGVLVGSVLAAALACSREVLKTDLLAAMKAE